MKSSRVIEPYRVPGTYVDDVVVDGIVYVVKVVVVEPGLIPTRETMAVIKTISTNVTSKKQIFTTQLAIESPGICKSEDANPIASCVS